MSSRAGAPSAALAESTQFRLGPAIIADTIRHTIVRDGRAIAVEPRVMQLLTYFASRPGEIISKQELRAHVWRAHVVDEAVHRAVSLLRSALGDSPRHSTVIETVPRHGYRLLIAPAAVDVARSAPLRPGGLRWTAAAALLAALAILVAPALRSGSAVAPERPAVAAEAATPVAAEPRKAAETQRQRDSRALAAAPEAPEPRHQARRGTPSGAQPRAAAPETGASAALAPAAPPARATEPSEAPLAPRGHW